MVKKHELMNFIFARLTRFDQHDPQKDTSQPATRPELIPFNAPEDEVRTFLQELIDANLLTSSENMLSLAHDVLVAPLTGVGQGYDRTRLIRMARLRDQARIWSRHDDRKEYLVLNRTGLEEAEKDVQAKLYSITKEERDYLDACRHLLGRQETFRAFLFRALKVAAGLIFVVLLSALYYRSQALKEANGRLYQHALLFAERAERKNDQGFHRVAADLAVTALDLTEGRLDLPAAEAQLYRALPHLGSPLPNSLPANIDLLAWTQENLLVCTAEDEVFLLNAEDGNLINSMVPGGVITRLAIDPTGHRLAVADDDGRVILWDISSGQKLHLSHHRRRVSHLAWNTAGTRLATAGHDGDVVIWNTTFGTVDHVLTMNARVLHTAFSPDGERLLTVSGDRYLRLWSLDAKEPLRSLRWQEKLERASFLDSDTGVFHDTKRTIAFWDLESGTVTVQEEDPLFPDTITGLGSGFVGVRGDGDREQVHQRDVLAHHHAPHRSSATLSPDARTLVTTRRDGRVHLWDVASQMKLATYQDDTLPLISAAFSPDGRHLITVQEDGRAFLRSIDWLHTDTVVVASPGNLSVALMHENGETLLSSFTDARLWDLKQRRSTTLTGHSGWITQVSVSRTVAATAAENEVLLWDIQDGQRLCECLPRDRYQRIQRLLLRLLWGGSVLTPPAQTGNGGRRMNAHLRTRMEPTDMTFSPAGDLLAVTYKDDRVRVWRVADCRPVAEWHSKRFTVLDAAFHPSLPGLLLGTQRGAILWNMRDELEPIGNVQTSVHHVAVSKDGSRLLAASQDQVMLFDQNGVPLTSFPMEGMIIDRIGFTPDGTRFFLAVTQTVARRVQADLYLYAAGDGRLMMVLEGHKAPITYMTTQKDGPLLATASDDGTARIWDSSGRSCAVTPRQNSPLTQVLFHPQHQRLSTLSADGRARSWPILSRDELIHRYRNLLRGNRMAERKTP